jgi:hypothetical protein
MKKSDLYLFLIFSNLINFLKCHNCYIPLGEDCQVAYYLREFKLRKDAYPFDWLITNNFNGVCNCIQEEFSNFLNPHYLKHENIVLNFAYNILFVHDFPTLSSPNVSLENENCDTVVSNYLDYISLVKNKFTPRIKRFFKKIYSGESIFFIRTGNISPEFAKKFSDMMKCTYPFCSYTLVAVHNFLEYDYDWNIINVKNFFYPKETGNCNGWLSRKTWNEIFKKLSINN